MRGYVKRRTEKYTKSLFVVEYDLRKSKFEVKRAFVEYVIAYY